MMALFDRSIFYFAIAMIVFGVFATSQWERTLYFTLGGISLVIAICWDWLMSLINKD